MKLKDVQAIKKNTEVTLRGGRTAFFVSCENNGPGSQVTVKEKKTSKKTESFSFRQIVSA